MESYLVGNVFMSSVNISGFDGSLSIEGGIITAIGTGFSPQSRVTSIDGSGILTLLPGFIDIHNHGAVGVDVNEADVDGLVSIAGFLAKSGVTAWLPTLVPDSDAVYRRVISAIDRLMELQIDRPIAQAVGVHYEGVFANEKMCGALRPEFFKRFSGNEITTLPRLKHGVHMTTFAPEVENGIELVRALRASGWIPSIGHTRADIETLDRAFDAGAKHVTHFFNAMTGIHHRDVGIAGWALTKDDVTFDIIADGIHVAPRMVKFACRTRGVSNSMLISDSVAPTGLGDGTFDLWGEKITVENGRTRNERGSIAGSVITMADAVKMAKRLDFSYPEIAAMASQNPARLLDLGDRGEIAVGKRADLVAIDSEGNIAWTMVGGQLV